MANAMKRIILTYLDSSPRIKRIVIWGYANTFGKLKKQNKKKNFHVNARYVLEKVADAFGHAEVTYWLDFGTLLGAIRENDFIAHDIDIDVAMWLDDYSEAIDSAFLKLGFTKTREIMIDNGQYGFEQTYSLRGIDVDIFFYTRIDSKKAFYHDFITYKHYSRYSTELKFGGLIVRELTMPMEKIGVCDFQGRQYPIPEPVHEHLLARYGENYLVKDANWNIKKGSIDNVKILHDKVGVVSRY